MPHWLDDPATSAGAEASALRWRSASATSRCASSASPTTRATAAMPTCGRPAAVWNVVAAPELSLGLKTWCFPVVGCVGYRGYYDAAERRRARAPSCARGGLEVAVYGVPAYSTLGACRLDWLADPLLNTFIDYPEGELARLVFHELAHQVASTPAATRSSTNRSRPRSSASAASAGWRERAAAAARAASSTRSTRGARDFRALTLRYRDAARRALRAAAPAMPPSASARRRCWRGCAPSTRA